MLSVVKEASSELVKRDQSLDEAASENSGYEPVVIIGVNLLFVLLRMSFEV